MSTINAIQRSDVHSAIARASQATGVDFDYLLAQAKLESGLDTDAKARTSSAAGLYQFISGTWLETLDKHGSQHGLSWADAAIENRGGRAAITDPAMRAQIMALRHDPNASALMAAELARDNAAELRPFLGREPDSTELYIAHFLGAGGAREFLGALQKDPGQSAVALFPQPAKANRAIFYDGAKPRSVGEVMGVLRDKVDTAMGGASASPAIQPATQTGRFTRAAATNRAERSFGTEPGGARRPSMAETLRTTFGAGNLPGKAGAHIDEAYGKLKAFGL